jgi:DNA-binding response OmpR family regulator
LYDDGHESTMKRRFIPASQFCCDNAPVRLLLIEDDASLAAVLLRALGDEGYSVDVAGRAVDGRHQLRASEYDLVVLDLGLPDGDGLALCREARAHGVVAPILVLTARDGLLNKVEGLDAGADDYLTKPFDFPELAARIRALLRRGSEDRSPILQADDIRLDPAARRVWRGAVTVPLTAREFSLLEYLMRHKGKVLTRTELLEHVWDAHYDGLSNVVDVHIANLRRKLDLPESPAPIDTIRGVGYQLTIPID